MLGVPCLTRRTCSAADVNSTWSQRRSVSSDTRRPWRNGPRLHGKPGTPEFIASYNEAVGRRISQPEGRLHFLIDGYQQSAEFRGLRERTKADYIKQIKLIETEFGDFPLKALSARETRGVFMDWRDRLALKSARQADYAWTVLARILSWAKNRGRVTINPCEKGGRLYSGSRVDFTWTLENEAAFLNHAPAHLHLPLLLALWTGQRQGDLLRLTWAAYDGTHVRFKQSKSVRRGARRVVHVNVPVGAPLKAALLIRPRSIKEARSFYLHQRGALGHQMVSARRGARHATKQVSST